MYKWITNMKTISSVQPSWKLSASLPTRSSSSSLFPKLYILKSLQGLSQFICSGELALTEGIHLHSPTQLSPASHIRYRVLDLGFPLSGILPGLQRSSKVILGPHLKKPLAFMNAMSLLFSGSYPCINVVCHKYKHKAGHKKTSILKLILEIK